MAKAKEIGRANSMTVAPADKPSENAAIHANLAGIGVKLEGSNLVNIRKIGKPDFDVLKFASPAAAVSFVKLNPAFLQIPS